MKYCKKIINRPLEASLCIDNFALAKTSQRIETKRRTPKWGCLSLYGKGIVQGVVKAMQTGILWSQVQVLVGPPAMPMT